MQRKRKQIKEIPARPAKKVWRKPICEMVEVASIR